MQKGRPRRRIWITIGIIVLIIQELTYLVEWDQVLYILRLTNWITMLLGRVALLVGFFFSLRADALYWLINQSC